MNIAIISPEQSVMGRVRLNRFVSELCKHTDVQIDFWGWKRNSEADNSDICANRIKTQIIFFRNTSSKASIFDYVMWMIVLFVFVVKTEKKDIYYCLGLDSAFPLALINKFRRSRYIFDNADNLYMSHSWPKIVRKLLIKFEAFAIQGSNIQIVPGNSRIDSNYAYKTVVLKNGPTEDILQEAKKIAEEKKYSRKDKFRIYVNGLLTEERGIGQILDAANMIIDIDYELIVCGEIKGESASRLIKLPVVKYLGKLRYVDALALYYCASLCITLYDPAIEINRKAEPNKWGDCEATGTKFIANEEIETLSNYERTGLCVKCPYSDAGRLAFLIKEEYKKYQSGCRLDLNESIKQTNQLDMDKFVNEYIVKKA